MSTADQQLFYLFRLPPGKEIDPALKQFQEIQYEEKEPERERCILCRQCHHVITSRSERIEVQGGHKHTFANPRGIIFQIGCFGSVRGCGYIETSTAKWSWFRGFSYKIAVCEKCLTHLGWLYTSETMKNFCGLILERLIDSG